MNLFLYIYFVYFYIFTCYIQKIYRNINKIYIRLLKIIIKVFLLFLERSSIQSGPDTRMLDPFRSRSIWTCPSVSNYVQISKQWQNFYFSDFKYLKYWIFSNLSTPIIGLDIISYFNSKQFRTLNCGETPKLRISFSISNSELQIEYLDPSWMLSGFKVSLI